MEDREVHVEEKRPHRYAGVVDQDVDAAETGHCLFHQLATILLHGNIRPYTKQLR